ncbi:MAG: FG-GAP repeat protein [Phycisphaerae bacterium]|nr:FG-GAP repeat protein [Phycisphaerae bacterium]
MEDEALPPPESTPLIDEERPVELPDAGDAGGSTTPDSGDGGGDGSSDGSGGSTAKSSSSFLRVDEPFDLQVLGSNTTVNVVSYVHVASGDTVTSAELVAARDENPFDQAEDGDPVYTRAITVAQGQNTISFNTNEVTSYLTNKFGRFLLGMRIRTESGADLLKYASGTVSVDADPPSAAWIGAGEAGTGVDQGDHLVTLDKTWAVQLTTSDNAPTHSVTIQLRDAVSGAVSAQFADTGTFTAGSGIRTFTAALSGFAVGTYKYYYIVSDGLSTVEGYAPGRLGITNRLVGDYDLNQLDPNSIVYSNGGVKSQGAILQGFNFNDMAGSSMDSIPDLNSDGMAEVIIVSRFGKPYLASTDGIGFGEAYLLYGGATRLRDIVALNTVGQGNVSGLTLPGIRAPLATTWTEGLSDVTVIDDMDGDDLPEIVFSFPRVESVSIGSESPVQVLNPDLPGMGTLEYDAYDYVADAWVPNEAQFTRGGCVIVSSHSKMLRDPNKLNRKGDRIIDLAEVGQLFGASPSGDMWVTTMGGTPYEPYVREAVDLGTATAICDGTSTDYTQWLARWDVVLFNQGPGGFLNHFVDEAFGDGLTPVGPDPFQPPLAKRELNITIPNLNYLFPPRTDPCASGNCIFSNAWYVWGACPDLFPGGVVCDNASWHGADQAPLETEEAIWTGFYGSNTTAVTPWYGNTVGARILGQRREDRFGTAVGAVGSWLYISAPKRTAEQAGGEDGVSALEADRAGAGVIYQLRTDARQSSSSPTLTQLWIEPGADGDEANWPLWPNPDAENTTRTDWTMPVPHQYIIETIGSLRGNDQYWDEDEFGTANVGDRIVTYTNPAPDGSCFPTYETTGGVAANAVTESRVFMTNYASFESGYYVDRTPQIVGPHVNANVSFVRGLQDVNDDGIPDFAIGSADVQQDFSNPQAPTGSAVGAVFIVFGRPTGLEGDLLLDRLALAPDDTNRLRGVLLRGSAANEKLGRVFDDAGDFNGDGVNDVVVGSEGSSSNAGQVIVILGSSTLESPAGGWVASDIVAQDRGIRFSGVLAGDLAGANVAGAGDVDNDGIDDILIAAPGAEGGKGAVYLIYGSAAHTGQDLSLADVGKLDLQGVKFIGRAANDQLGGGELQFDADRPGVFLNPANDPVTVFSRGVTTLGDIDGDGDDDYAISSMLADPNDRVDSGEVYLIYGRGNYDN